MASAPRNDVGEPTTGRHGILRLATELAEGFLAGPDKSVPAKVLTIVRDPA